MNTNRLFTCVCFILTVLSLMVYLSIQHKQDGKQGDGTEKAALAVVHIATAATKRDGMIMVMDMGWTHFIQQFLPPHLLHASNSMENVSL